MDEKEAGFLAQLLDSLEIASTKFEKAYKEKDKKTLEKIAIFIIHAQKKIESIVNG